ncbi:MAG: ABC-type spermidine/putrescine transporter, permease [Alphaproteobacteria bacterium]|jgi:putative spermidine/putrescine transport system permease protein|nr:ABC-type spermidine/putrescine transporter, permease [Alphaproteobacteria bacterium]
MSAIDAPALPRRLPKRGWGGLIVPAVLVLLIVFVLPIGQLALNSLHVKAGPGMIDPTWTLDNYIRFLSDPFYYGILLETFILGIVVVSICLVIGFPVAYFLARTRSRWRGALIFAVVSPLLISVVIRNLGWLPVLGSSGVINWLLLSLGILSQPVQLINNYTGVVIGLTHALSPFMILSLMTVIQRIEPEIEEASINLGASPLETFWRIVVPLSRPGVLAGYLLVFTVVLSAFTTPGMMGGNRVLVMSTYIGQQIRTALNYPFAAMAAIILMLVTTLTTLIALRLSGGKNQ